ncbi:hypothetical protein ACIQPQ_15715 [Streptomyces sp. NPDC091281]
MGARYLLLVVPGVGAALALTRSLHLDLPAAVIAVLPFLARRAAR